MRSTRLATIIGALALATALGAGPAAGKGRCAYCGSYTGSTKDAVDPVGNTSGGGPFGFVVKKKGVVAVTASGTWNCSNGSEPNLVSEPFHVDRTFTGHPSKVGKKGSVFVDKHFGDLHVSFDGTIKKGKFSGRFAVGFLNSSKGCGTATLPATAKK
jgi:hypothetical protein